MAYKFDKSLIKNPYEIQVDTAAKYGYFENIQRGGEGGLWFADSEEHPGKLELIDYDGYFELPTKVYQALIEMGFILDDVYRRD